MQSKKSIKNDPIFTRGVEEFIGEDEIVKILKSNKKLRVKFGIDPTASELHLGHLSCLHKLNEFQEMGHTILFIIGDYTAQIGDPSGRDKSREFLTDNQIKVNMKDYLKQAGLIINTKKIEIYYNSQWYQKSKIDLLMKLASLQTLARVIERDDFQKRMKSNKDISLQEIFYPLLQAYDSVMVKSDLEIGGTDQKFNLLMGREIQRKFNQKPQAVMTLPLLVGIDGKKKMSKSFGNYIGLLEDYNSQFGKIMSIPDDLILSYFEIAARTSGKELAKIKRLLKNSKNRKDLKQSLARDIVAILHGSEASSLAQENFNRIFRDKQNPIDMPIYKIKSNKKDKLVNLLVEFDLVDSKSKARRLIEQGGIKIDDAVITDVNSEITLYNGMIIRAGKMKFLKIQK